MDSDIYNKLHGIIKSLTALNGGRRLGVLTVGSKDDIYAVAFGGGEEWARKIVQLMQTWQATEVRNAILPAEAETHIRHIPQLQALVDSFSDEQAFSMINWLLEKLCQDKDLSVAQVLPTQELLSLAKRLGLKRKDSEDHSLAAPDNSSTSASPESGSIEPNATSQT